MVVCDSGDLKQVQGQSHQAAFWPDLDQSLNSLDVLDVPIIAVCWVVCARSDGLGDLAGSGGPLRYIEEEGICSKVDVDGDWLVGVWIGNSARELRSGIVCRPSDPPSGFPCRLPVCQG